MVKLITLFTVALVSIKSFAQSKTDTLYLFEPLNKQFVTEKNSFSTLNGLIATIKIKADDPGWNDDKSILTFSVNIAGLNTKDAVKKFDLIKDSSRIKSKFEKLNSFNKISEGYNIFGTTEIISIEGDALVMDFDVVVTRPNERIFVIHGRRKLERSKM